MSVPDHCLSIYFAKISTFLDVTFLQLCFKKDNFDPTRKSQVFRNGQSKIITKNSILTTCGHAVDGNLRFWCSLTS